jgi:cytidylate kinase
MGTFVVTIARGFGSGGKRIGSQLARELGINCYENRILTLASQYSGYDEHYFVENDERLRGPFLVNQLGKLARTTKPKPVLNRFTSDPKLFSYQEIIIKRLAETESCVILGKCADYVLREYDNVVSVYIEAPRAHCLRNILRRMDLTEEEANELITKTDRYRADYYKFYTNGNYWTNPVNYDLTLNSERVGDENCVKVIRDYLRIKNLL